MGEGDEWDTQVCTLSFHLLFIIFLRCSFTGWAGGSIVFWHPQGTQ